MTDVIYVLDTESTGLDIRKDRPVQICLLSYQDGVVDILMDTLVNPAMPIPLAATEIHGIRTGDVAHAPHYLTALDQLVDLLMPADNTHTYTVGFNSSNYDIPLLNNCYGSTITDLPHIDVLRMARHHYPDVRGRFGGKKLEELYEVFVGEQPPDKHDARGDAWATLRLFIELVNKTGVSLHDLAEEQRHPRRYQYMPLGKFIGWPISEVPRGWAYYMSLQPDLDQDLRATVDWILDQ